MVGFDEGKMISMVGSGLRKTFGFKDIVARCTTIQGAKRSKKPALDPLKMESLRRESVNFIVIVHLRY